MDLPEAAELGDLARVKLLVEAGGDVNAKNAEGLTPLHLAAFNGHPEVVDFLLAHGADPQATDGNGDSPLHYAASSGKPAVVHLLVKAGAEVNRPNDDGDTPLDLVKGDGGSYDDMVQALTAVGAVRGVDLETLELETPTTVAPSRRAPVE